MTPGISTWSLRSRPISWGCGSFTFTIISAASKTAAALGNPLRTVYAALDDAIGRLVARVPDARVLVVSDHGFGGAGTTALHLNRWLAQEGYLAFTPRPRRARWAGALRAAAVRAVPAQWQAPCFRVAGGRLANRVESGVRFIVP